MQSTWGWEMVPLRFHFGMKVRHTRSHYEKWKIVGMQNVLLQILYRIRLDCVHYGQIPIHLVTPLHWNGKIIAPISAVQYAKHFSAQSIPKKQVYGEDPCPRTFATKRRFWMIIFCSITWRTNKRTVWCFLCDNQMDDAVRLKGQMEEHHKGRKKFY